MPAPNYAKARRLLHQVCVHYIGHQQSQEDHLLAKTTWDPPSIFFQQALNSDFPKREFNDWVTCFYFEILHHSDSIASSTLTFQEKLPCFQTEEVDSAIQNAGDRRQDNPALVLSNLDALIQRLNKIIQYPEENQPQEFNQIKTKTEYDENAWSDASPTAPLSTQIFYRLEKLKMVAAFLQALTHEHKNDDKILIMNKDVKKLPDATGYKNSIANSAKELSLLIQKSSCIFEGYLKKIAVTELQKCVNPHQADTDQAAVEAFQTQLDSGLTLDILSKSRQSNTEHHLKLVSVIAIVFGIGILSTAALALKRLYDSGGSSINFFKPLSRNLSEDVKTILKNQISSR